MADCATFHYNRIIVESPSVECNRMNRPFARQLRLIVCLLLACLLLLPSLSARAHGYLIRVIPADRAVLERSPTRLQAWFSEGLEPRFSTLSLAGEGGQSIPLAEVGVVPNNTSQLSARIAQPLPDGAYVLTMRVAFASDGHIYTIRQVFWVGQATDAVAESGVTRSIDPLEVAWRAITMPSLHTLFGLPLLYGLVLLGGWGNPKHRAGRLPPRVMNRLLTVSWIAVSGALIGTILAVLQQSAALFATDVVTVIRDSLWNTVLNGTQIGDTLRLRLMFIVGAGVVIGGVQYLTRRAPDFVTPLYLGLIGAGAAALFTISISSHAAGADLWPVPSVFISWLHILANGAWIGGLIGLAVVLGPALAPLQGENRRSALAAVLRRFAGVGVVCVLLLMTTGMYQSALQIRAVTDFTSTDYGLTLLAKYLLILPLLLIAAYHHLLVGRDQFTEALRRRFAPFADRLAVALPHLPRSIRIEALIGIFVLGCTALLAATPPPLPNATQSVLPEQYSHQVGDLTVRLTLDPGGVGGNTYSVALLQHERAVEDAQVWLRFSYPSLDQRTQFIRLDAAGAGEYLTAGIELDRAGLWQAAVDVRLPNEASFRRAAFRIDLPEVSPALNLRQPALLNWIGLVAIVGALGVWIVPPIARRIQSAGFNREITVIFVALSAVTIIFVIAGGFIINEASRQTDRLRNPPPSLVNPQLADQPSLDAGRAAFEQSCAACHGSSGRGDGPQASQFSRMPQLRFLEDTRRDEQLLHAISRGIGNMPAVELPDTVKWAIINYLRSPAFADEVP